LKDRIKKLRKELDLTQQEFADRLGTARNNIAGYETGKRSPSDAVISLICTKFNVNESWLRDGTGEMFVEMDVEDRLMDWAGSVLGGHDSKFKKRFVTMLMGLSESEWEFLEKKAKELVTDGIEKGD
jgi:transcriptional regulator with XRE-family HTH domain